MTHILIADSSSLTVLGAETLLKGRAHTFTTTAENADDLCTRAERYQPALILLGDPFDPLVDLFTLVDRLRRYAPQTPIIVMGTTGAGLIIHDLFYLGIRGYLIVHVDRPMTGHDLAMTRWRQYWRRAVRAGHAYAEVAARFRGTATPLWERDARRNLIRGSALLLTLLLGVAGMLLGSVIVPVLVIGLWLALALRTALKVGWKSRDPLTRFLYGIHSHLQQIPILVGQLGYYRDRWRGRRRGLIEYK